MNEQIFHGHLSKDSLPVYFAKNFIANVIQSKIPIPIIAKAYSPAQMITFLCLNLCNVSPKIIALIILFL